MPYQLLKEDDARRAEKFKRESIKSLKLMEKHNLAKKRYAGNHKANIRISEMNAVSSYNYALQLMGWIKMYWAYCRQKIQDPATPASQKRAFRKLARIIESQFGIDYLARDNPYARKMGFRMCRDSKPEIFAFCWTPARV